jgi:hypothetical protein
MGISNQLTDILNNQRLKHVIFNQNKKIKTIPKANNL